MKKMLLLALVITGCASGPKLTEAEKAIVVKRGSFTLDGCTQKGVVREMVPLYFGSDSYSKDHAGDALRIPAAAMGANTVIMLKDATFEQTAIGEAYFCK